MVDDGLAGLYTDDMGVAYFVGALRSIGGGAWLVCVAVCCGCLKVPGLTFYCLLKNMGGTHRLYWYYEDPQKSPLTFAYLAPKLAIILFVTKHLI